MGTNGNVQNIAEIVIKAQGGDEEAFTTLYQKFRKKIFGYVYSLSGQQADAEDITQEAFTLAYKNLKQLREPKKFPSWLYRISRNEYYQRHRLLKNRDLDSLSDDNGLETAENIPSAIDSCIILSSEELQKVVKESIEGLPPKYRHPFYLAAIEKLSYKEIAEIVGRSPAAVKSEIYRAREEVRYKVNKYLQFNLIIKNSSLL